MMHTQQQQKYRSKIEIIGNILDVTSHQGQDGINISGVSRKANLSHYAVMEKCNNLEKAGLIESKRVNRNVIFTITWKGIQFFEEFKKFQRLMEQANLKC